jgi:hypothetical protein
MKHIILSSLIVLFVSVACRKTYTCTCDVNTETTKITVPRNSAPTQTETNKTSNSYITTRPGITKTNMRRTGNCNSRNVSTQSTYTVTGNFDGSGQTTADVNEISEAVYTCVIK